MTHRTKRLSTWLAVAVALLTGAWLGAEPILPPTPKALPGEVQSLAGLHEIRLSVAPLPKLIKAAGVTESELGEKLQSQLKDAEFVLANNDKAPLVLLRANVITDPEKPDVQALAMFLEVQQGVRVLRINQDVDVPTSTLFYAVVTSPDHLARDARFGTSKLIQDLSKIVDSASRPR